MANENQAVQRRRMWRRQAVHGFFATAAQVGDLSPELRRARANVEILRDIAYGPHPVAHRLDIYRPRFAPRPLPVLVYIHGGAFTLCSKETHRGIALIKAHRAGYLVFNINYRLAPRYRFPAAIADACMAYRWIARHAAQYGGDAARIVVAGESAGGNLALGVAIAASYRRPEPWAAALFDDAPLPIGVAPLMPYLQTSDAMRHADSPGTTRLALKVAQEIAAAYLGAAGARPETGNLMADPIRILEEGRRPTRRFPSVFTGVGTADLCCKDVQRLEVACERLGIPITARYYPGEVHAFHAMGWRPVARLFWQENLDFLRQVLQSPERTGDALSPTRAERVAAQNSP